MAGNRVIRDPLYDYVTVPAELFGVVDHPIFQRLRRVRQTSLTLAVYPSATGSRFEHALGAMHLAQAAVLSAWERADEQCRTHFYEDLLNLDLRLNDRREEFLTQLKIALGAVALLHDVGHPPFSHALEPIIEPHIWEFAGPDTNDLADERADMEAHELAGLILAGWRSRSGEVRLGPLLEEITDHGIRRLAASILSADENDESCLSALHSIVAGPYDVDRLDYLARDNHRIGTEFGGVDHTRLIGSFELHELDNRRFVIAPGLRARSAVETLLSQRVQSYRWVIFHSRVVGTNTALARGVELAFRLCESHDNEIHKAMESQRPNLNYLNPRSEDVALTVHGVELPKEKSETAGLFASGADEAIQRLRLLTQAGVDDDTITGFLKSCAQAAEALLATKTIQPDDQRELRRLVAYVRSALFREKRFIAVWKTNDEYLAVADEMADQLLAVVEDCSGEVSTNAARLAHEAVVREFDEGPAQGLNHLVRALASTPKDLRRLEVHLSTIKSTAREEGPGWWVLTYAPLKALGRSLTLFDGATEVDLIRRSPFVAALKGVDRSSTALFAHFFFESQTSRRWGSRELIEARRELRQTFAQEFPRYVRSIWPVYLNEQEATNE